MLRVHAFSHYSRHDAHDAATPQGDNMASREYGSKYGPEVGAGNAAGILDVCTPTGSEHHQKMIL